MLTSEMTATPRPEQVRAAKVRAACHRPAFDITAAAAGRQRPRRRHPSRLSGACTAAAVALALGGLAGTASAQVTVKNDGIWRHLFTAGLNVNSGNTSASALNIASDSVRATDNDKWSVTGLALYSRSDGQTSAERFSVNSQYNANINERLFGFVQAAGVRDRQANLRDRLTATTGLGWHLMKRDDAFWDVWAGVAVNQDRYVDPVEIGGALRSSRTSSGLVLAQESSHSFGESTTFKQKLVVLPNLRDSGQVRSEFNAQLSVAMSDRLSLSTGLSLRHDNRPPPGLKKLDTALVTGVSLRFD
jgi:putative salt-induced outer membrane protein